MRQRCRRVNRLVVAPSGSWQTPFQLARPALNAAQLGACRGTAIDQDSGDRASLSGREARVADGSHKHCVQSTVLAQLRVE